MDIALIITTSPSDTVCRCPLDLQGHITPAQPAAYAEFVVIEDVYTGLAECRDAAHFVRCSGFEAGGGMFGGLDGQCFGHGR